MKYLFIKMYVIDEKCAIHHIGGASGCQTMQFFYMTNSIICLANTE